MVRLLEFIKEQQDCPAYLSDSNFERAWRNAYPNGEAIPRNRENCDDQLVVDLAEAYDELTACQQQLVAKDKIISEFDFETIPKLVHKLDEAQQQLKEARDLGREHDARLLEEAAARLVQLGEIKSNSRCDIELRRLAEAKRRGE